MSKLGKTKKKICHNKGGCDLVLAYLERLLLSFWSSQQLRAIIIIRYLCHLEGLHSRRRHHRRRQVK